MILSIECLRQHPINTCSWEMWFWTYDMYWLEQLLILGLVPLSPSQRTTQTTLSPVGCRGLFYYTRLTPVAIIELLSGSNALYSNNRVLLHSW